MAAAPVESTALSAARTPAVDTVQARRTAEEQARARARLQEAKAPGPKPARPAEPPAEAPAALPAFGHFHLGAREALPFGPDQEASALTRIPGDGVRTVQGGVDLGHRPARGLNILA